MSAVSDENQTWLLKWRLLFNEDRMSRLRQYMPSALLILLFIFIIAVTSAGGIRIGGDTGRYTAGAENFLAGQPLDSRQLFYSLYTVVIAACQAIGIGLNGVVALQLVAAAAAMLALYNLGCRLGGTWVGIVAAGLFAADPRIIQWHFYILTDSLYISMAVLSLWSIALASEQHSYRYGLAILPILAAALLRPNGWLLMPIAIVYWIFTGVSSKRRRWIGASTVIILSVLGMSLLSVALRSGYEGASPTEMLLRGDVIWNDPVWRVPMPPDPLTQGSSLAETLGYVIRHPLPVLWLATARVLANFADVRYAYSVERNVLLVAWLAPVYILAVIGAVRTWQRPPTHLYLSIIGIQNLLVAMTFADWDGRFVLYVTPPIYLLTAYAAAHTERPDRRLVRILMRIGGAGLAIMLVAVNLRGYIPRSTNLLIGNLPAEVVPRNDIFGGQTRLVGFTPLVADHQPGHYSTITLYWQAVSHAPEDYVVTIQMISSAGERIAWVDQKIGSASYPEIGTSIWPVSMKLSERYTIHIPEDAPPVLDIYLSLVNPKTQERLHLIALDGTPTQEDRVRLGRIGLLVGEGIPALKEPITEVSYKLGEALHVTGFSLPLQVSSSDDLAVGVRVEAYQPLYEDYILFFHLLDDTGNPVAQSDSSILSGDWTTAALIPGYPLGATRLIDLPDDLPTGEYRLMMGMYSYPSMERLPTVDTQGNPLPNNLIEVGGVRIQRD